MEVDWVERMKIAKEIYVSMMGRKCIKPETHDWFLRKQYDRIRLIREYMLKAEEDKIGQDREIKEIIP